MDFAPLFTILFVFTGEFGGNHSFALNVLLIYNVSKISACFRPSMLVSFDVSFHFILLNHHRILCFISSPISFKISLIIISLQTWLQVSCYYFTLLCFYCAQSHIILFRLGSSTTYALSSLCPLCIFF